MIMQKSRMKQLIVIIMILLLQCSFIIYWGIKKEGLGCDELYSYELANDTSGTPFLYERIDYLNIWHDAAYFKENITVQPGNRFSFYHVVDNQIQDVHPPLYYLLLNSVCSIFPNSYSKWLGLGINIILLLISQWILYRVATMLMPDDKYMQVILLAFYGFSFGIVNLVMYIRMYMLVSVWVLVLYYFILKIMKMALDTGQDSRKMEKIAWYHVGVFVTITCGMLTHYYFVIAAFFLSGFYVLFLIYTKKWKLVGVYVVSAFGAMVNSVAIFPEMLMHIFGGYRGTENIDNLKNANLLQNVKVFLKILNEQLFGKLLIPLLAVIVVCRVYIHVKRLALQESRKSLFFRVGLGIGVLSVICYFVLVSKISIMPQWRFFSPIYPILMIALIGGGEYLFGKVLSQKKTCIIMAIICGCILGAGWYGNVAEGLWEGSAHAEEVIKSHSEAKTLYISKNDFKVVDWDNLLAQMNAVYITDTDDIAYNAQIINEYGQEDVMFVLVEYEYNDKEIIQNLLDNTEYDKAQMVYKRYATLYLLER